MIAFPLVASITRKSPTHRTYRVVRRTTFTTGLVLSFFALIRPTLAQEFGSITGKVQDTLT